MPYFSVTALLEYIDSFLLNAQKGQILSKCRNSIDSSDNYAQNYSSIIPAP